VEDQELKHILHIRGADLVSELFICLKHEANSGEQVHSVANLKEQMHVLLNLGHCNGSFARESIS